MIELPIEYLNKLANQLMFISTLLAGFSFTVLVLLIDKKNSDKIMTKIFIVSAIATNSFLISIMAMTSITMKTTDGYPLPIKSEDFIFPRTVGILSFFIGIISIVLVISLFGWAKSKKIGLFTTIISLISIILILKFLSS